MKRFTNLLALILAVLVAVCVVAWYLTRDAGSTRIASKRTAPASQAAPMDERLLQTARQLAPLAETNDEQRLALTALGLADHELDQAFATAMREAEAPSPPATGPLKQLADRITQLKTRITADQAEIAKLTKQAETNDALADQLEPAKAQLALDQDELEDAQQDLARQGGDPHAQIARALAQHEAIDHAAQPPKFSTAVVATTLRVQIALWLALGDGARQVEAARQQAAGKASTLVREHEMLEKAAAKQPAPQASDASAATTPSSDEESEEDPAAVVARLRRLSDQQKTLTELNKRIQDVQQLADVYKQWGALVATRRRSVLHLLVEGLAAVFAILLTVTLIDKGIRRALARDRKRLHHIEVVGTIAVQVVGALLVLLIIFGPPTQTSTIIGLTTAGLTVALKDFIVAFFGWFALMGRNGVRVGDWVEIQGVSGEVIEIGLLKTVLLEMGNWTATGHPTGRRVAFVNSYAIEGHYFNFSTAGQWLWDELQVTLPASGDPYHTAQQIRQTVERETEANASAAEQDWERVTRQYGIHPFSAKPVVDLRPTAGGLTAIVRYITRAPQRYELKSRLFEAIVDLLHKPAVTERP